MALGINSKTYRFYVKSTEKKLLNINKMIRIYNKDNSINKNRRIGLSSPLHIHHSQRPCSQSPFHAQIVYLLVYPVFAVSRTTKILYAVRPITFKISGAWPRFSNAIGQITQNLRRQENCEHGATFFAMVTKAPELTTRIGSEGQMGHVTVQFRWTTPV